MRVRRDSRLVEGTGWRVLLAAAALLGGAALAARHRYPSQQPKERRPNIILIMTDDQDVELGSLTFMPRTLKLLRDGGAEFRHAYTTTPMCCPSRSSMLTGMYMHNHQVYTNNGNCSGPEWQASHETRTFATYLSNAGYRTGYFGKYLNKYTGSYIPPGWREWGGLIMNSRYYNYSINLNGRKIKHGYDYHKDYYPDLIANDSVRFLRQSKQYFSRKPVMLVLGFPAPHGPEDSAPQYSNMFFNITSHHTPSYDYAPNPDKQWILKVTGRMQPIHRQFTDLLMTKRLQTLQSVDVAVEKVVEELKALGELDNTYIFYTSDHGYHLGQFGLVKGKSFPFEFDVRVPFLVRGPGIEPGTVIDDIVLNIDLAPTFLDIAGVDTPPQMDGRSFLRLINRRHKPRNRIITKWPDTFLIESSGRRDINESVDVKLEESLIKLEEELNYTLNSAESVSEGHSETTTLPIEKSEIYNETHQKEDNFEPATKVLPLKTLDNNDGQIDNQLPIIGLSKMERLAIECQRPEFKAPCKAGQKWQCLPDGNRWRKHKCKHRPALYNQFHGKKCACFTPSGLMYTIFEMDDRRYPNKYGRSSSSMSRDLRDYRKHGALRVRRDTQQTDADKDSHFAVNVDLEDQKVNLSPDIYNPEIMLDEDAIETLTSVFKHKSIDRAVDEVMNTLLYRKKRSNVDSFDSHVKSIMGVLEDKLHGLEESSNDSKLKLEGNCTVELNGNVVCTENVYQNPKTWKANRDQLDDQIRKLRLELEKLKEIRRHLKEKRPHIAYDNSLEDEDSDRSLDSQGREEEADGKGKGEPVMSFSTSYQGRWKKRHRHHHLSQGETPYFIDPKNEGRSFNRSGHDSPDPTNPKFPYLHHPYNRDTCYCGPHYPTSKEDKEIKDIKESRRKTNEERLWRKERKLRKKAKLDECLSEKMNCFNHDNEHWKTPPFWTEGPFCFCMNANNNTYSCIRTINATHNFLYCEFVTGLITYYNLRVDPFEQWNRVNVLTEEEKSYLHDQLEHLKRCKGSSDCTVGSAAQGRDPQPPQAPQKPQVKKKRPQIQASPDLKEEHGELLGNHRSRKLNDDRQIFLR